jgi:hypothetical protein
MENMFGMDMLTRSLLAATNATEAPAGCFLPSCEGVPVSADLDPIHHWAFVAQALSYPCSAALMIYAFINREDFKANVTARFPVYVAFADNWYSTTHFFDHLYIRMNHVFPPEGMCYFYAFSLEFAMLANMLCVVVIGAYCLFVVQTGRQPDTGKYDWKVLAFGYGIPFFISILPFATESYGHDGAWCWIRGDGVAANGRHDKLWYNLIPLVLVLIINIGLLSTIYYKVSAHAKRQGNTDMARKVVSRVSLFILAYIIQFTPLTVFNVIAITNAGTVPFEYILAVVVTINLGGLLNGLVYGRAAVQQAEEKKQNRNKRTILDNQGQSRATSGSGKGTTKGKASSGNTGTSASNTEVSEMTQTNANADTTAETRVEVEDDED